MNSEATALCREVASEIESHGGLAAFKAHSLKNLELRTVLRESHCTPVSQLSFNHMDPSLFNLFACVGKDQVTIYDDLHMGDHVGIVVHYVNAPSAHHQGGEVTCCGWVQMKGVTRHEPGDACLAVSGPEGVIQVISVIEGCVTQLLTGHEAEVVDLRGCVGVPGLLLSLSADGRLRLWDAPSSACLASVQADATTAELHPDGTCFLTGHADGRVCRWPLSVSTEAVPQADGCFAAPPRRLKLQLPAVPAGGQLRPQELEQPAEGALLGHPLDCIRVLSGGRLAVKSSNGLTRIWDCDAAKPEQLRAVASFRVPADGKTRCLLSPTHDGTYICAGGSNGDAIVFESSSGARMAEMSFGKVSGAVRACALSEDCRHLLAVKGNGFVFRYEYIREEDEETVSESGSSEAETETDSAASESEEADGTAAAGPAGGAAAGQAGPGPSSVAAGPAGRQGMVGGGARAGEAPPAKRPRGRGQAGGEEDESGDADMEDNC